MPVFWFLVVLALALLWFALACLFTTVGKFAIKFFGDAFKIMNSEREDEKNEE